MIISCKGKIPRFGTKPRSNYSNSAPGAIRATQIYNRTVGSDDDNKVDLNNSSRIPSGNYNIPPQVNYKPSIDLSKIKVEMPKVEAPELKKPNFKYQDFNSKESQERMVKAMMELDKIKNQ
jgi:endonuclease YncB( thermonuclease family)